MSTTRFEQPTLGSVFGRGHPTEDTGAHALASLAFELGLLTALLAIWHDSHETRTGDIPHTARPYLAKPEPSTITADQTAHLPEATGKTIRAVVDEYEEQQTPEARCAKDADKLECLIQAIEYRHAGHTHAQGWIDSSRKALTTHTRATHRRCRPHHLATRLAWPLTRRNTKVRR